ncbi:DUF222 domain-containing protein [Mycolicibacterium komossense]|uniref:DUF222 domain-containing protein n=1 Tax=Mycolicibacterium komossense TaxID=1779 RepID=A0ABT3C7I4_9MYCO|nr:13E12 repeat family protein [Mycolicibacterium komossense]MCV7225444.1 DUF222 domain-containing protein [Mycolicibacterium komossense]
MGAKNFSDVLTTALRISPKDAKRRLRDAEELGERRALTGQPLAPRMPHVAAGQAAGVIGGEHSAIIRGFFTDLPVWVDTPTREKADAELAGVDLPVWVDTPTREKADAELAGVAAEFGPEELRKAAALIAALVNPDGEFSDADRARKRGVTIGRQGPDAMSTISGQITPGVAGHGP